MTTSRFADLLAQPSDVMIAQPSLQAIELIAHASIKMYVSTLHSYLNKAKANYTSWGFGVLGFWGGAAAAG